MDDRRSRSPSPPPPPDRPPASPRPRQIPFQRASPPALSSSVSPPPRRTPVRLKWTAPDVEPTLARANELLMSRDVHGAVEAYTRVLEDAEGHPIAFLNRSLCYFLLDYPSLAACDAYRAYIGICWADDMRTNVGIKLYNWLLSYTTLCNHAAATGKSWALAPLCNSARVSISLLGQKLASLVVSKRPKMRRGKNGSGTVLQTPSKQHLGQTPPPERFGTPKFKMVLPNRSVIEDAMMKALYRLALALWKCGGGAMRTALDVIALAYEEMESADDRIQFQALESKIWDFIQKQQKREKKTGLSQSELSINNILSSRYTRIKREVYPWDNFTITTSNFKERLDAMNLHISTYAPKCCVNAQLRNGRTPSLHLHAVLDIGEKSSIFDEASCFHVTTAVYGRQFHFCDACGAALKAPEEAFAKAEYDVQQIWKALKENQSCEDSPNASTISENMPKIYEDADARLDCSKKGDATAAPTPPNSDDNHDLGKPLHPKANNQKSEANGPQYPISPLTSPCFIEGEGLTTPLHSSTKTHRSDDENADMPTVEGFQFCPTCSEVAFCSRRCHANAQGFHPALCETMLERTTRSFILPQPWRRNVSCTNVWTGSEGYIGEDGGVPTSQTQKLELLMLTRVMSHAAIKQQSPLAQEWCQMFDGNLAEPGQKSQFTSHKWNGHWSDDAPSIKSLFPRSENGSKLQDDAVPWSFDNDIVKPLNYLFTINEKINGTGPAAMMNVTMYDGWMLNTLIAKLQMNMRVTKFSRVQKRFSKSGLVKKQWHGPVKDYEFGIGDVGETADHPGKADEEIWVGSLHPLFGLLREAGGEGNEESVNVKVWEADGSVACTTISPPEHKTTDPDEDTDTSLDSISSVDSGVRPIVIKAGEELVWAGEIMYPQNLGRRDSVVAPMTEGSDTESEAEEEGEVKDVDRRLRRKPRRSDLLKGLDTLSDIDEMEVDMPDGDTMLAAAETQFSEYEEDGEGDYDIDMDVSGAKTDAQDPEDESHPTDEEMLQAKECGGSEHLA